MDCYDTDDGTGMLNAMLKGCFSVTIRATMTMAIVVTRIAISDGLAMKTSMMMLVMMAMMLGVSPMDADDDSAAAAASAAPAMNGASPVTDGAGAAMNGT